MGCSPSSDARPIPDVPDIGLTAIAVEPGDRAEPQRAGSSGRRIRSISMRRSSAASG
jgi:hypothetical protein